MARLVSLALIALLIGALGAMFYRLIAPFMMPLFLAAMTALLVQPVFRYFLARCRNRRAWAAGITTGAILSAVLLPILVVTILGVLELFTLAIGTGDRMHNAMHWAHTRLAQPYSPETQHDDRAASVTVQPFVDGVVEFAEQQLGPQVSWFEMEVLHVIAEEDLDALNSDPQRLRQMRASWILQQALRLRGLAIGLAVQTVSVLGQVLGQTPSILAACAALLVGLSVYAFALYYFLADGPDLIAATQALIPIEKPHQEELMQRFAASVRALVLATFLAAIGQGLATAIGMKVIGLGPFFLLLMAATLAALIPMTGTWLVWFPYACWLFWEGRWGAGIFLSVYGIGVVGMLDNVIRTYVLQSGTKLHPLLAVISVFGGLEVMGLWGVFIGPIVACCLHALLEIFNIEIRSLSATVATIAAPPPTPVEKDVDAAVKPVVRS